MKPVKVSIVGDVALGAHVEPEWVPTPSLAAPGGARALSRALLRAAATRAR